MWVERKRLLVLMGLAVVLAGVAVYLHVWPRPVSPEEGAGPSARAEPPAKDNGQNPPTKRPTGRSPRPSPRTVSQPLSAEQVIRMARQPEPRHLPELKQAARSPSVEVREAAVVGIGRLGEDSDPQALMAALGEDESPAVRVAAATALGKLKYWEAGPLLIDALEDPDARVRSRAGSALNRIVGVDLGFRATDPQRDRVVRKIRGLWPMFYEGHLKRLSEKG